MDDTIRAALDRGHTIDITTTGRHTGKARRIEIVFHNLDGRIVISGMPMRGRTRAWIHNVDGTARIVTDPVERRQLLTGVARNWNRTDIDLMVEASPLIEVTVPGYPA